MNIIFFGQKRMLALAAVAALLAGFPTAGALGQGSRTSSVPLAVALDEPSDIVAAGDGKLLVFDPWKNVIERVDENGSLDPSFGDDGRLETPFADVTVDPQGRLLLAGWGSSPDDPDDSDARVTRLLPDGRPDASFGIGGVALVDMGGRYDSASKAQVFPDGKIVLAGFRQKHEENRGLSDAVAAVARLLPDGKVDRSFGDRGVRVLNGGFESWVRYLSPTPGGGIVAAGPGYLGSSIWKLTSSGSMDSRFSGDGTLELLGRKPLGRFEFEEEVYWANDFSVLANGKILALGTGERCVTKRRCDRFDVVRLLADGRIDRSYGRHGWAMVDIGYSAYAGSMTQLPGGRTLVAGGVETRRGKRTLGLLVLNRKGRPLASFGRRGRITIPALGGQPYADDIATQAGRAFVLASTSKGEWLVRAH